MQDGHVITQWFGLRTFVLLQPADPAALDEVDDSLVRTLLSALRVAAGNVDWAMPLFVQADWPSQQSYEGALSANGAEVQLSTVAFADIPPSRTTLSALAELFGTLRAILLANATCRARPSDTVWAM